MSQAQLSLVPAETPVFNFKSHSIRTVVHNNEPWFVARDVCAALGIRWTGHALNGIPEAWVGMVRHTTPRKGGNQTHNTRIISEPAVYKMAFRSNKQEADEFTNWVASEVLPAIRRTGKFEVNVPQALPSVTPVLPELSTPADRKPLRSLVNAWARVSGQHHDALWPQVKAHFQLERIDDLPVDWLPDALAFVQGKIDAAQQTTPAPVRHALPRRGLVPNPANPGKYHPGPIEAELHALAEELYAFGALRGQFESLMGRIHDVSTPLYHATYAVMPEPPRGRIVSMDALTEVLLSSHHASMRLFQEAFDEARRYVRLQRTLAMIHGM